MKLLKDIINMIKVNVLLERDLKTESRKVYANYIFNNLELTEQQQKLLQKEYKALLDSDLLAYQDNHTKKFVLSFGTALLGIMIPGFILEEYSLSFYITLSIVFSLFFYSFYQFYLVGKSPKFFENENSIIKNIIEEKGNNFLTEQRKKIVENIDELYMCDKKVDAVLKNYIIEDLYQNAKNPNDKKFLESLKFSFSKNIYEEIEKDYDEKINNKKALNQKNILQNNLLNEKINFIKQSKI